MEDQRTTRPPLWISETDEHGNRVRPEVVEAAHRIWNRILQHLRYAGQDVAPAAEILESACHCVSRAIRRNLKRNSIRNLDSYLFWAFIRKHTRRMIREGRIQYVDSVESVANANIGAQHDWVSILENEIHLKPGLSKLAFDGNPVCRRQWRGMRRTEVESTTLRSAGYTPTRRILELEFTSGAVYQYLEVPASIYRRLLEAASKGSYFNHEIRDDYQAVRLR